MSQKIAIISFWPFHVPRYLGGTERFATIVAQNLLERGYNVKFFHGAEPVGLEMEEPLPASGAGLRMRFKKEGVERVRKWDPDYVFVFGAGIFAFQFRGIGRRRFLQTAATYIPREYAGTFRWLLVVSRLYLMLPLLHRDYVFLYDTKKVGRYVGRGILFPLPIGKESELNMMEPVGPGSTVVYWGRICTMKGTHLIPEAISLLQEEGIGAKCRMFGIVDDPVEGCEVFEPVNEGRKAEEVRKGNVSVFPSINEAYGAVVGESIVYGVLPVTTCNYGIREYIPSIPCFSLNPLDIATKLKEVMQMELEEYGALVKKMREAIRRNRLTYEGMEDRLNILLDRERLKEVLKILRSGVPSVDPLFIQ